MPAMSRGSGPRSSKTSKPSKVVKPSKRAKATPTTRRHHFETFSHRITRIKIDPVRRSRRLDDHDETSIGFSTYFGSALEEWTDLNLSQTFTAFVKEAVPLSDNLPKVLHNHDKIMDLLVTYIEKQDVHALEPLLSLMSHFAHDLDTRFEHHFQRAVATIAGIAARIDAVDAVEWSFTCLAWLFKYLSRLLVPDLCPLYDLMAPFLGRTKQKPFIIRFSAEAMSFLIRKAATTYGKSKAPLEKIIAHILDDFQSTQHSGFYAQGVMTLLSDAVKGQAGFSIHSGGCAVLAVLSRSCLSRGADAEQAYRILLGALVSTIHHTDAENFGPVLETLLQSLNIDNLDIVPRIRFSSRILLTVVGTRKGTRVSDWRSVLGATTRMLTTIDEMDETADKELVQEALDAVAVVVTVAPSDVLPSVTSVLERLIRPKWQRYFLQFCGLVADLDPAKFQSLLLSYFQRFIVDHWADKELNLCCTISSLRKRQDLNLDSMQIPTKWQDHILKSIREDSKSLATSDSSAINLSLVSARLDVMDNSSSDPEIRLSIAREMKAMCSIIPISQFSLSDPVHLFACGRAYPFTAHSDQPDIGLLEHMIRLSHQCQHLLSYWTALRVNIQRATPTGDDQISQLFSSSLLYHMIGLLSDPSHNMRSVILQILAEYYRLKQAESPDWLEVASNIENTPPTSPSLRFISMQIRRMALIYKNRGSDILMSRAIPTYCFGILHLHLSQAWDDAIQTLKDIVDSSEVEEVIVPLLAEWLQGESPVDEQTDSPGNNDQSPTWQRVTSDFECSNLNFLKEQSRLNRVRPEPAGQLTLIYNEIIRQTPLTSSDNRSQALRVLHALPQLAEKKSRMLVPVLLKWVQDADAETDEESVQRWSRKDQKGMLSILALFQNPRVLYRSAEVYDALLVLLANGDFEIQRSALQALLAWRIPEIVRYKEHLNNLLDDARFNEEVSIFLHIDEAEGIRRDDCQQLMPVLLRLLYGRAVTRTGLSSGAKGQQSRRKAIFRALAGFQAQELAQFIGIALKAIKGSRLLTEEGVLDEQSLAQMDVSPRKLFGLLNMLDDLVETIGSEIMPCALALADAALLCLFKALMAQECQSVESEEIAVSHASLYANIRQTSLRLLSQLFTCCPDIDWPLRAQLLMDRVLSPRLERFPIETAQSISGILRLFSAWSSSKRTAPFMAQFNLQTLTTLADCLVVPSAQVDVKLFVIEHIFDNLLGLVEHAKHDPSDLAKLVAETVIEPNSGTMLDRLGQTLKQSPPKHLLDAAISCVSRLAPFVKDVQSVRGFLGVSTHLLRQPNGRVSPKIKHNLLKTLCNLLPQYDVKNDPVVFDEIYNAICPLFSFFRDSESRQMLCLLLKVLTSDYNDLARIARLCEDLESYSRSRLDEPDYERRSAAFVELQNDLWQTMTVQMWTPIVYDMLYHIRDNEELAIRTSASYTLRRLVETASTDGGFFKNTDFEQLITAVLLPGLQKGCKDASELVRVECLAVMACVVKQFSACTLVNGMQLLLANDDDEASFFSNILHIQQHRRLRALRRLAEQANDLPSRNINDILIPLLEHFVFDQSDAEGAQNLAAETIKTLGALSVSLEWAQYRTTLRRFIGYIKDNEGPQKPALRLVGAVINALHSEDLEHEILILPALKATLPSPEKLAADIKRDFLPPLTGFLHLKDESIVSLRVPVAVTVVKLLKVLSHDEMALLLPSVLMDICHILRSKDQVARDLTRRTLAEITGLLGPSFYGFVFKELRSALQRGYQLHVLSYTVHSILVANTHTLKPGDLDYCLPVLVSTIMDDIFGVTGQEKDAEEYVSKMKEVKSSKSFDSMEMVCKITTLGHLREIIVPIQTLLAEKLNHKTVSKIDELLRRAGLGVTQNTSIVDRDILMFCYEIIQQAQAATARSRDIKQMPSDYKTRKYIIQMHAANKSSGRAVTTSYIFKLVRFAFDLLRSVLQKHEDLRSASNIARFLPVISDALVGAQEEVQLSAIRLLTCVIKVPSSQIEKDAPVYAAEVIRLIRNAPSMTTETAQAALKLLNTILRERPDVKVRDTDIALTLKRLKPDLDEPDRQGVIFNFIRSVLGRKIVITEVYEILDVVAEVMVTNQTRSARDLARGAYFQFIMDYPQGKERLAKQVNFIIKNLDYKHVEGRKSTLELVHLLLNKTTGDLFQDVSSMLFVPLIMTMANDEEAECREMAGALIGKVLAKADDDRRKEYLGLLRTWLEQDEQVLLKRIALQCWNIYLGVHEAQSKDVTMLLRHLNLLLPTQGRLIPAEEWELLFYSLQLLSKLRESSSGSSLSPASKPLWTSVYRCLLFPHAWVKQLASALVGALLADVARQNSSALGVLPLLTSAGMEITGSELHKLCLSSFRVLKYSEVSEKLVAQTARNLTFLGRCFAANGMPLAIQDDDSSSDEEGAVKVERKSQTALQHLFYRLTVILRRDLATLKAQALRPKTAALQILGTLINHVDSEHLAPSLDTIILPLHHLTDKDMTVPTTSDTGFTEGFMNLTNTAQEVISLLQKKLGTAEYIQAMSKVQALVRERREGRRQKRRIERVAEPDKAEKEKRRRYESKKTKRKEKGQDARGRRRGW